MKSIKEKSCELFPEMQTDSDDWDVIEEQCDRDKQRKAFANGANYVLEQIEGHINRLEYGLNANCMVTAKNACECLRSIMEQLKK